MDASEPALSVRGVTTRYGKVAAIRGVDLDVHAGEVVTLLGANGSGKTTLINTISGFLAPAAGTITIGGERIGGLPPHRVFRHGVAQVSQGRDLFADMSVIDNLRLGAATREGGTADDLERVFAYFPRLEERRRQRARTLSGGEQQMLAIGRALMGRPRILLLDEPSGGLAPRFVDEIGRIMRLLKEERATMLLVEQNIALAMSVADRFYIMRAGEIAESGRTAELAASYKALAQTYYL